ncbi:Nucleoside diphosphate kinase [Collinsella sp. AK_207A]|uniref:nucleoside-diphosphate kinase n=1 Tax=Collinsella sp. AK_207A TaxID=2650472 RepID=UPI0012605DD6|nr:Nucleoside diphosphate kinase [Collinsella sp. AK_207A]
MAAIEKTYSMIKPDAVRDRKVGEIISRIERSGLTIERMELAYVTVEQADENYKHLKDKPFYPNLIAFMTGGPVVKMVISGLGAVAKMRSLMGATNPLEAAPGTIRGDFAIDVNSNVIHGSDSVENAEREIKLFFGE